MATRWLYSIDGQLAYYQDGDYIYSKDGKCEFSVSGRWWYPIKGGARIGCTRRMANRLFLADLPARLS